MSQKQKKKQNNGRNRQQRRQLEQRPYTPKQNKPLGMRIAVLVMLAVMLLGFVIIPLIR